MAAPRVSIYSTPDCDRCKQVKQFLSRYEVPFVTHDLTTDVEARRFMDDHGYRIVPVITIDDLTLMGGDLPKLKSALLEAGLL